MIERRIEMRLPKTLWRFWTSNAFVRCVIGPVGSGKSSACVAEILRRAAQQEKSTDGKRRSRFAVIRNTYSQLRDTTQKTFEQWVPREIGTWHKQEFKFDMKFGDVESEVLFRALDRPEDIKKLLSLELTGAYINEAREVPKEVLDLLQARVGRYPSKAMGGASWFGVWMDSNPWHDGHWGQELFKQNIQGYELFRQPGGRSKEAENVENLPDGYYERLCAGKDEEWIRVYVDGQDASGAIGSVYGELLNRVQERNGITEFTHPTDGVYASFDLGWSDSTAIWFWRVSDKAVDLVDYYEAHGQPLSHYFDVLDTRGYDYAKLWLPHDARAKSLQTGASTIEQFEKRFPGKAAITPQLGLADGITVARWLLEKPIRFHSRCAEGVKTLRAYRYEWDETKQVFSKNPVHDFASHGADAFRYVACAYQKALSAKTAEPTAPPKLYPKDWTLNDLMSVEPKPGRTRRV